MAKSPNLSDIGNISSAATVINSNYDLIIEAFRNTLSRDGSTPNQMEADIDLNSNNLLNVKDIDISGSISIRGTEYSADTIDTVVSIYGYDAGTTVEGTDTYALGADLPTEKLVSVYIDGLAQTPVTDYTIVDMGSSPSGKGIKFIGAFTPDAPYIFFWARPVTTTGEVDGTLVTLSDGSNADTRIDQLIGLETRAEFVTWVAAGNTAPNGFVKFAGGLAYEADDSSTAISDLTGWKPAFNVYPNHWGDNSTPFVTDMKAAIQNAFDYVGDSGGGKVALKPEGYAISDTVRLPDNVYIDGSGYGFGYDYNASGTVPLYGSWIYLPTGTFNTAKRNIIQVTSSGDNVGFARYHGGGKDFGVFGNRHDTWDRTARHTDKDNNAYGYGIHAAGASYVTFTNVLVMRCADDGWRFDTLKETFDPSTDVDVANDEIDFLGGHDFFDGLPVYYLNGAGTDIGGLLDTTTYYIVNSTPTTIQLAATEGGDPIDLTNVGTGTAHTLEAFGNGRGGCNNMALIDCRSLQNAGYGYYLFAGDSLVSTLVAGANGEAGFVAGSDLDLNNCTGWDNRTYGAQLTNRSKMNGGWMYDNGKPGVYIAASADDWSVIGVTIQDNGREPSDEDDKGGLLIDSTNPGIITGCSFFQKNNDGTSGNEYQIYGISSSVAFDVALGPCNFGPHTSGSGSPIRNAGGGTFRGHSVGIDTEQLTHHGFILTGDIDADANKIENVSGFSADQWGTITSISSGSISAGARSFNTLLISGGGTVTDIVSSIDGIPLLVFRNADSSAVTFQYNSSKLRTIGGVDVSVAQNEAIMFAYVSGNVWQQIGGKF